MRGEGKKKQKRRITSRRRSLKKKTFAKAREIPRRTSIERKRKEKKKKRTVDFVRWNRGSDIARDVRDFLDNGNGRRGSVMWLTKVSRFERFISVAERYTTLRPVFIHLIIVITYRSRRIDDDSTDLSRACVPNIVCVRVDACVCNVNAKRERWMIGASLNDAS